MIFHSHPFTTAVRLLGAISLSMILYGCDSDAPAADPRAIVTINPSATQGTAPFTVTFDVEASNTRLFSGTWDFGDGTQGQTLEAASITHTFAELGRYTTTVTFDADRLFVEATEYTVEIRVVLNPDLDPPEIDPEVSDVNLIVSSFAIDSEVTPGGIETVSAIIQNIGTGPLEGSGFLDVGYFLSVDETVTVDDIFIGDTSIAIGDAFFQEDVLFGFESLGPGENYQYDHQLFVKGNLASLPAGMYYAGAIVDFIDEYEWYSFPRSTDTSEFVFPSRVVVPETDEEDNVRVLPAYQISVTAPICADDTFEPDDSSATATVIAVGASQDHNFCFDNSDWLQFNAVQGNVYKITTSALGAEADTQLILYDRDGESILLFHDNIDTGPPPFPTGTGEFITPCGPLYTVDLECGTPPNPASEIVWEAQTTGTYFIKTRVTTCDEDKDPYCSVSPDGAGLSTEYSVTLQ